MLITLNHFNERVEIDLKRSVDLSISNAFNKKNPSFFNSKNPKVKYPISNEFIGNISKGGKCNVPNVSLDIHCTGTHTECKNHITNSNEFINDVCPKHFIPSTIISIKPVIAKLSKDKYHVKYGEQDSIITEQELSKNINTKSKYLESLIIRTLPNESDKLIRNYDLNPVAFFSNDAIKYILNLGVKHLLVDLPSIDRGNDHGLLGNHHLFFEKGKTISELLFIPNKIEDGVGFLQIQIPNWSLDAAPSRPIFCPV